MVKRRPIRAISCKQIAELKKRKELKAKLIIKSGGRCMTCGNTGGWLGLELVHKIPLSQGGKTDTENCTVECTQCHSLRHHLRVKMNSRPEWSKK